MKIENYVPFITAFPVSAITEKEIKDAEAAVHFFSDLLDYPKGYYVLSLCNPKCTVSKEITREFGHGIFYRDSAYIKYYLVNALIDTNTVSIKDIASVILNGANKIKELLIQDAPAISKHLIPDLDMTIKHLFDYNHLNEMLPISVLNDGGRECL